MALRVEDVVKLKSLQDFELEAGKSGLSRYVACAGILDYECVDKVQDVPHPLFEDASLVISSLLFAKEDPSLILPALERLLEVGASAFAYKTIFFHKMPPEVIAFAEEKHFPIFRFGQGTYFENVIFEIMEAVQYDDARVLTESRIRYILDNQLTPQETAELSQGLSLRFRRFACAAYLKARTDIPPLDTQRLLRNYYHYKYFKEKAMVGSFNGGIFLLMTANSPSPGQFHLIYQEYLQISGLHQDDLITAFSQIHDAHKRLPACIRESLWAYRAAALEAAASSRYNKAPTITDFRRSGTWQFLVPLANQTALTDYAASYLAPLEGKEGLLETALAWVYTGGDLTLTAQALHCHQNTIRYRLSRMKDLLEAGDPNTASIAGTSESADTAGTATTAKPDGESTDVPPSITDFQLYERLSAALKVRQLAELGEDEDA